VQSLEQLRRELPEIENKIRYSFEERSLLELAFVHRSFVNENRGSVEGHNERLEFLGDAVLGLIVSDFLYLELPEKPEGDLSYLRSRLVEASTCSRYIERVGLETYVLMGKGESMNEGKGRASIQADLFEALIGAIYLDGGMEAASTFFFDHYKKDVLEIMASPNRNWKAELQDYCQKNYQKPPTYTVEKEEGPDHEKIFHIVVSIDDLILGNGEGSSKKEAEQSGAQQAIEEFENK